MDHHLIGATGAALLTAAAAGQVATFQGLETRGAAGLPIQPSSYATGVSGDGAVITGGTYLWDSYHQIGLRSGMRWNQGTGWTTPHPGWLYAASADGTSIAGYLHLGLSAILAYVERNGVSIPTGSMGGSEYFTGLSANGLRAAGTYGLDAVWWTQVGGAQPLPHLPGGDLAEGRGISGDGLIVVGHDRQPGQTQAFKWTAAGGTVGLGFLGGTPSGALQSSAAAASADGRVIVGRSLTSEGSSQGFIITPWRGMEPLPLLPGYTSSEALAVSGDGSVVVGSTGTGSAPTIAYYWDRARGKRDLRAILVSLGATGLDGWTLRSATAISPDGSAIAGNGVNPQGLDEAWLARIPAFCYANCDGSTIAPVVNANDFVCFLNRFAAGDPYANCDWSAGEPAMNVLDFVCFLNHFAAGCD